MGRKLLKLKFHLADIDSYGPANFKKIADSHICEVITTNESDVKLKVYFDSMEYLGHKIECWHSKSDENFLKHIEVQEILKPDELVIVDFSSARLIGMTNSTEFYEDGKQYFTIDLDAIRLGYKNKNDFDSEFYLNETSFKLIESIYRYQFNFSWNNPKFKWEPINKNKEPIRFHKISFVPEHYFFVDNNSEDREVLIKKIPRFRVINEGLAESQIKAHIHLLCDLFSFYSQETIDYGVSKIYAEEKFFYEILRSSSNSSVDSHGMFRWELRSNPLNLVQNIDTERLLKTKSFVSKVVSRFVYGLKTQGESKFMILYNVLEQIRNQFITNEDILITKNQLVIEEFRFIPGKNTTDKKIRETLMKITEIVHEDDKVQFEKEIPHKVKPIKFISQKGQFDSFFKSISIEPSVFELEFQDVKNLRDSIFHGHSIKDKSDYLEKINHYKRFPKLVGTVILRYFGIDDISKIKLIK